MTVFRVSYLCIILPKKSSLGYSLSFHKEIWAPYSSADEAGTHLCPSTDTSVFPCQPWGNWSGKQPILLRLENCNPNSSGAKRFPCVWVLSVPCIQQGWDSEKQNVPESENVWERTRMSENMHACKQKTNIHHHSAMESGFLLLVLSIQIHGPDIFTYSTAQSVRGGQGPRTPF